MTMQPFYQDDLTTLYHGDCLEVMPMLEAQSFDAIICDPPYGTTACAWDSPIPFAAMWACLKRLAMARAAIVLFGSQPFTSALVMSNIKWFRYEWVWDKKLSGNFLLTSIQPNKIHENIVVFSELSATYHPQKWKSIYRKRTRVVSGDHYSIGGNWESDERYPTSIIEHSNAYQHGKLHPTQKPLALMEYLIRTYTNEGDRILDFTCGSGTTLRAAKNLKRHSVGIERERHYCEITVKRLAPTFEQALVAEDTDLSDLPLFMDAA